MMQPVQLPPARVDALTIRVFKGTLADLDLWLGRVLAVVATDALGVRLAPCPLLGFVARYKRLG